MPYFKNRQLAEKYHVSPKTVSNWIDQAKEGKADLELIQKGSYSYVADTPANGVVLESLAAKGKKYRNAAYFKTVSPRPEFYEIYSDRQILDIITNLSVHGEVPLQYNYLQDGAKNWEDRMARFESEGVTNSLVGTIELIQDNLATIDRFLKGKKKVNVIDLGVGNARPVKELLGHLLERGVLNRYIGIDISPTMLEVANRNIEKWYGDAVKFEGYVRDITNEQFDDLLVEDMLDEDADQTINLVLLLGGTPVNFRSFNDAFKPIFNSMHRNDVLIHTLKPDTHASRRYLDLGPKPGSISLAPNFKYILDLLNIDESLYEAELGFDAEKKMRYTRVRLKAAVEIQFDLGGSKKRTVSLEKGEAIQLYRAWHLDTSEIIAELSKARFTFLHASLTEDGQYFMTISGVENRIDADRP
ncbi:class I SAM-dependent methyltransferase [Streptomyces antibioticus]|uniref:class I SAM-dependent methyltransferase n=1 Tax=Streptomyces antibioticus TaxID=1890 RepID=UPI002252CB05|nr:class I SAM-dependent methyltransferase [Streptomyces antibioticus]MCX4742790.1 class I SAM-dependent methyltransferase [Streptomyces antibioticus]